MSEIKSLTKSLGPGAILAATLLLVGNVASATPTNTISSSVGGLPNVSGINYLNFDSPSPLPSGYIYSTKGGKVTVSFAGDGQAVTGSVSGQYAAPYLVRTYPNFGTTNTNKIPGPDYTQYLTSGSSLQNGLSSKSYAKLVFSKPEQYLGLLWGSVDSFNTLGFYDNSGHKITSYTGMMVNAKATGLSNNRGPGGTNYVNINLGTPFTTVLATSGQKAFEFDNVGFRSTPVPEPGSLGLLALGLTLLGFGVWKRKRNQI